jgi:uncharacterized membrane protein
MDHLIATHSVLRWVFVVLMVLSLVEAFTGKSGNKSFEGKSRKIFLFTLITLHVQVFLGLAMYYMSDVVDTALASDELMKNSSHRFWAVEHMVGMLLGATLITIGWSKAKKAIDDAAKFKKIALFYTLGFILIMATIPWPFRELFAGRSWFPGM